MEGSANGNRIRIGVLTFPLVGLVALIGALTPGIGINPTSDPAGFAQTANTVGLVNLAGLIALVLQLYGFQALYVFLSDPSRDRPAFLGMTLSVVGIGLYLPFLGIIAIVGPIAGKAYLSGQTQAITIVSDATSVSNPAVLIVGGTSVLLFILGSLFFSIAMWKSDKIPRWAAIAYLVAGPLNIIPHYVPALWFAGAILLLAAGVGIVQGVWKTPKTV